MSLARVADQGVRDLAQGVREWRVGYLLGMTPLRNRYARSRLGEAWVVITTAISVTAFGIVWAKLWGRPIEQYLPYVAISSISWSFVTSAILEGSGALIATGRYFLSQPASFASVIYGTIWRCMVVFLHHTPIFLVLYLVFPVKISPAIVLAVPGLLLDAIAVTGLAYTSAILCTRFRDMSQIISSALNIGFFVTPVMWEPEMLPKDASFITELNPLAAMLAVVRDPLAGRAIHWQDWRMVAIVAAVSILVTIFVVGATRRRMIYWL